MNAIKTPLLKYYGSKFSVAREIYSRFPKHDCYVDVFGGGAALLYLKPPSPLEIYNDRDEEIYNFFQVFREQFESFVHAVKNTPYSRLEYDRAWIINSNDSPLERARKLYVRCWQGISPEDAWKSGWRCLHKRKRYEDPPKIFSRTNHLYLIRDRLKQVQFEHLDAIDLINKHDSPKTFFCCDPPYLHSTRTSNHLRGYRVEMTDEQHYQLAQALQNIQGMAIVCGYDSPQYREWYSDWNFVSFPGRKNGNTKSTECLWISPNCQVKYKQLELKLVV